MEDSYGADLGVAGLRSVFKVMVVAEIAAFVLMLIPPVSLIAMIVVLVATIMLLVRLIATSKAYEDLKWRNVG